MPRPADPAVMAVPTRNPGATPIRPGAAGALLADLLLIALLLAAAPSQARERQSAREVALSLVRLIHLQKVCPRFMTIDQGLASTMARNLLVSGYEDFGADAFDAVVGTVSNEFSTSLMPRREAEWCGEEREDYRRRNRDGLFR